ncbi:MAG: autotransporter-associated beta strand repeat-containing protein [Verrucomicrobia bacterium]|nr:autotransporter-associated beta strand repeat-containing protein [Verrucomicrobiota bacterium]
MKAGFRKTGRETLTLDGSLQHTGFTRVSGGTLLLAAEDVLSSGSVHEVQTTAILDLNDFNQRIAGLHGGGTVSLGNARLTIDSGLNHTFSGMINGGGDLVKLGSGELILTGQVSHTGTTEVHSGKLALPYGMTTLGDIILVADEAQLLVGANVVRDLGNNGSVINTSEEPIEFAGAVSGMGHFLGGFLFSGVTSPGNSSGILTVDGNLTFSSEHLLEMEIGGLIAGAEHDQIAVSGNLTLDGNLSLLPWNDYVPQLGDVFQLFTFATITGSFSEVEAFPLEDDLEWDFSNLYLDGSIAVIPEPRSSALLAGLGIFLLIVRRSLTRKS